MQVDQYIHRILAEADANNPADSSNELFDASSEAGRKLYRRGDFSESKLPNLDVYLLKKVKKRYLNCATQEATT